MATFIFSLSENMASDPTELRCLFKGLRAVMMDKRATNKLEPYEEWREKAITRYVETDVHLQKLLKDAETCSPQKYQR